MLKAKKIVSLLSFRLGNEPSAVGAPAATQPLSGLT
jgi:hypothetical protein